MTSCVYKILNETEWHAAQDRGTYLGSAVDHRDGFIHLSTREQVADTLRLHFAGQHNLVLVSFESERLTGLKWEPSRGGQLFPHLYGELDPSLSIEQWSLTVNDRGEPQPPW